ncbi:hypothetical protein PN36_30385 [Candidatus Thiomargarita nelsonii]|uniref:Uncharacterized protein n=1 Tax=Candidatus Thiomargarita nelsonii TaxID=1003181 RepID=A0A4E0QKJ6_9GAMM|nr:hypothetical protein PN36_30385 [Candidatus Thiomargarita nelsonii]
MSHPYSKPLGMGLKNKYNGLRQLVQNKFWTPIPKILLVFYPFFPLIRCTSVNRQKNPSVPPKSTIQLENGGQTEPGLRRGNPLWLHLLPAFL